MNPEDRTDSPELTAIASIRRFMRPRAVHERCALCGAEIGPEHPHLVDASSRQLACACDACALLFSGSGKTISPRAPRCQVHA